MSGDRFVDMKSTHTALWNMSEIPCKHKQFCEYQMLPLYQESFLQGIRNRWKTDHLELPQLINQGKCMKSIYEGQFKGQAFQRRTYTVSKVFKTTGVCLGRCSLKIWMQKAHCVYITVTVSSVRGHKAANQMNHTIYLLQYPRDQH